jgi:hypothetical protein
LCCPVIIKMRKRFFESERRGENVDMINEMCANEIGDMRN